MSNAQSPATWLDTGKISQAVENAISVDNTQLQDILAKSLGIESLNLDEIAALLAVRDREGRKLVAEAANDVKQKVYGDRIVITAPLHVSNHCGSGCLYCSARKGNGEVARKRLSPEELRQAGRMLIRQGHKRVMLVSGQTDEIDIYYYIAAIESLFRLADGPGEIRRINANLGVLKPEDYAELAQTDVGAIHIYQETYHEPSYRAAHPSGPKSDYAGRLTAPGSALRYGMKDVGLGLCLGLGPTAFDVLALAAHADHLAREYGIGSRNINLHRCRPAPGCDYAAPYAMNDADFLHTVAVTRLAVPYAGIILTTREPAGIWREGCDAGGSQLITGSLANPYESWVEAPGERAPFPIGEATHLDDVVQFLLRKAKHLPSFCSACPRLGRNSDEFLSMVRQCAIKSQCGPNSLASFQEFLLNYSTPYTRELGEKLISEKLANLEPAEKGAAERLLEHVRAGRVDEFI